MMVSWFNQSILLLETQGQRMRLYVIAITLVATSVPFLHLYMDDQLSLPEITVHTLNVAFSTAIAILLFELMLWGYLRRKDKKKYLSVGLFWVLFFGVFSLSFAVMHVTHDFSPITLDIWNKHIEPDLAAAPWKIVPIALLIGYILIQLIHRYQVTQELADLKKFNEQLRAVRNGAELPENDTKERRHSSASTFILPYKGEDLYLDPALIIRVESNENYCHVFVASNEQQDGHRYMARITLTEVISQLSGNLFLQVHRSHLVNFTYVESLKRQGRNYQLKLTNGDCIPVSRSRIKKIQQRK